MWSVKVYRDFAPYVGSYQSYICFVFIVLLFSTCNDDDPVKPVGHINSDFQVYVDRFVKEAEDRGFNIDTTGLSVIYSDTLKNYCGWGVPATKTVVISSTGSCFKSRTDDLNKEILIFHELGHALLRRNHDDSFLPNHDKRTIMSAGDLLTIYNKYCSEKRTYYLDELFNENTLAPLWAKEKIIPTIIFSDSISNPSAYWGFYKSSGSTNEGKIHSSNSSSSLQITAMSPSTYSLWYKFGFPMEDLKQSDRIELSVRVELDDVTGDGVILQIEGFTTDGKLLVIGTNEFVFKIDGSSNFVEYTVNIPYYYDSVTGLQVNLVMGNQSTGKVYFDDVKVTKYE